MSGISVRLDPISRMPPKFIFTNAVRWESSVRLTTANSIFQIESPTATRDPSRGVALHVMWKPLRRDGDEDTASPTRIFQTATPGGPDEIRTG